MAPAIQIIQNLKRPREWYAHTYTHGEILTILYSTLYTTIIMVKYT